MNSKQRYLDLNSMGYFVQSKVAWGVIVGCCVFIGVVR